MSKVGRGERGGPGGEGPGYGRRKRASITEHTGRGDYGMDFKVSGFISVISCTVNNTWPCLRGSLCLQTKQHTLNGYAAGSDMTCMCVFVCFCVSDMGGGGWGSHQDEEALVGELLMVRDGGEHGQHQAAEDQQKTETHTNTHTQ